MFTDWINDGKHCFITGNTGAGKTTLSKQIAHETERDIVVVLNPVHSTTYFSSCRVKTPNKVLKRLKKGKKRIEYLVGPNEREEFNAVYSRIKAVVNANNISAMLIVDEADRFAAVRGSIKKEALIRAIKTARNHNIKMVTLSQGFSHINRVVVQQSAYIVWVGSYNMEMEQYYKRYNIPYKQLPKPPKNPHDIKHICTLIGPNFRVLQKFKADKRFTT